MTERKSAPGRPRDHAANDGFPDVHADAPLVIHRCAEIVRRIQALTNEHGVRCVARQAGISHSTLSRTLQGEIWPSFVTIVAIEAAFDIDLWKE